MRRRVHLHGRFATYHDGPIEVIAETVWEAIEAVTLMIDGFKPHPLSGRQRLQVVGFDTFEKLKQQTDVEDIHVVPAMSFGKKGGIIQTIVGAALVVVGLVTGQTWLIQAGVTLMIGGLLQMLMPQPKLDGDNKDEIRSKYLGVNQNTVRIGTTIPLLYGRFRAAGHIMSLNVDAKDTTNS